MTTLVANSSGRKSTKDKKVIPNKNASPPNVTQNNVTETINNHSEEFRNKVDKFQPTAEQMRIASLMSDKKDENDLKKIEQIVELTGASTDDAAIALFDCDNDMAKAVEMILDGDPLDSEWQSTGRKKKTKSQTVSQPVTESMTNGNKKTDKPSKPNLKSNNVGNNIVPQNNSKGQRGGLPPNRIGRKKENRLNDSKPEGTDENDIFAKASIPSGDSARRGGRRGVPRGMRGAPRGTKVPAGPGRGSRTFMNRGLQPNDTFPNSIETWTNSTAEQAKSNSDDLNTMTVGNWSDIAANEDWSEEDWTSTPMETKVFTPSTKTIAEKDEIVMDQSKTINHNTTQNSSLSFISPNKNEETSQPTMSAILSGNIKRTSAATPGQALLQQIQQSSAPQNSNLNQYSLSQYSKQATESIKSLVGLSSNIIPNDLISPNDHSLDNNITQVSKQPAQQQNQQNRLKVQNQRSKIPESAVEMPNANDPMTNMTVHFGSLEFGANNSFSIGANDSNLFDSVNQNVKPESKNLSLLSSNVDSTSNSNFRSNVNQQNKSILQSSVLPQTLNESILNSDHRNDKSLNANSYNSNKPQMDRTKNDISYVNMAYKQSYANNDNTYSSAYQTSIPSNVGYYSNSNQITPFGNSGPVSQSLMASNAYNTSTYNNVSANVNNAQNVSKIRDIDNSVSQQQVTASSASATNKPYDTSSNVGTSLSLMSNSTVTTNVLKNTLSATGKGVHSVPPGVQPTQVLSAPYIMSNPSGMPIPYPYPYDVQFQTNPRDHGYPYAAADVKYNRGSESDMLPVSSQAAGAVQTATQAHNQPYMNTYPPGYGLYFAGVNFAHQGFYNAQHALYPVAQAQTNPASAGSAFAKNNAAANYGSHSYNSGYDSLGAAVAQTQDYSKAYPQQLQAHKQISGTNSGDLSGSQSMYGKNHSQMNKNYDKQGFQQSTQFNLSNSTQSNLSSYPQQQYMLPQQTMHHTLTSAEQTQQAPVVGNQRSLNPTHKGSASTNPNYKFNWN